jgi:hypothetical protein
MWKSIEYRYFCKTQIQSRLESGQILSGLARFVRLLRARESDEVRNLGESTLTSILLRIVVFWLATATIAAVALSKIARATNHSSHE